MRPQGGYGKIVRMKTVLVFSTSTGNANTEMMDGVRKFAQGTDWNIQSVKFDGSPFPIRELLKFWSPIGCIVEASGNGLKKDSIPYRAFGKMPVVYIGGDSLVVPPNATCVVHDAHATGEAAPATSRTSLSVTEVSVCQLNPRLSDPLANVTMTAVGAGVIA